MWQILLYNWHFYAAAVVLDLLAVLWMRFSPPAGVRVVVCLAAAVATFWALSSLLVSHYVYDRSHLYQWNWLPSVLKEDPEDWANIHAGLDQSSESLIRLFPNARHRILDIFAPSEMSEPSIDRARRYTLPAVAAEKANPLALPLEDCECDAIFLIFVAHELRRRPARLQFFHEICRALKPSGCIVLVEHLRDWKNFLAYGPGALHFFSRREWLAVGAQAGFNVTSERSVTPFVRCFVFIKTTGSTLDSHLSGSAPCV
ncbi:MAG TPA: class I SAM-dependent methyltransferase [Terriglobales bacterium]